MSPRNSSVAGLLLLLIAPAAAVSQGPPILTVPKESPRATASQTVGLTEISLTYDRPAVKGRKIWGGLVPYDSVWRAGANQNTVLASNSAFTIGGTRLPAGRYGLHVIPNPTAWTIIVSRQADAWGSFSYDAKEDVARFSATPRTADFIERLQYTFEDPTDSSVNLTLHWEKLAVQYPIIVATRQVVLDSLRQQLRGLPRFFGASWGEAARWALTHNTGLDLAEAWADTAVRLAPTFGHMQLKAALMERRGDAAGADALRQKALAVANEAEVNIYGYQLLGQGKTDQAIEIFRKNVRDYPRSWNTYDSLGEALGKKGDKKQALANYQKALDMVTDEQQKTRIRGAMAALK
jgi:tetratricopeptide (TPR) repeat protein